MKILGWLTKMAVAAVFIAAVTIYATWTAVGTYLEKVLAHYQIGGDMQSIGFLDFVEKMGTGLNIMNQSVSAKDDKPVYGGSGLTPVGSATSGTEGLAGKPSGTTGSGTNLQQPNSTGGAASGGTISGREEKEGSINSGASGSGGMADALPVWSQSGSAQGAQSGGTGEQEKTLFSSDFLSSTKDNMSNDDKVKLFTLLVSKLPAAEVQSISQLMENGITQEELVQLDKIIRRHLTQEEYKQVVAILEKYQ
jgi:hypothetical protein